MKDIVTAIMIGFVLGMLAGSLTVIFIIGPADKYQCTMISGGLDARAMVVDDECLVNYQGDEWLPLSELKLIAK